jgi:hypothetical protein
MKQTRINTARMGRSATSKALAETGYRGSGMRPTAISAGGRGKRTTTIKRDPSEYYSGIVVHGSPVKGLKQIDPALSSATKAAGYTDKPSVFLWDPTAKGMDAPFATGIAAQEYAKGSGSIYVGKVVNAKRLADGPGGVLVSKRSVEVLDEIDPNNLAAVDAALEKYGVKRFAPTYQSSVTDSVV